MLAFILSGSVRIKTFATLAVGSRRYAKEHSESWSLIGGINLGGIVTPQS